MFKNTDQYILIYHNFHKFNLNHPIRTEQFKPDIAIQSNNCTVKHFELLLNPTPKNTGQYILVYIS